jgi:hypothetical protein
MARTGRPYPERAPNSTNEAQTDHNNQPAGSSGPTALREHPLHLHTSRVDIADLSNKS